MKKIFVLLLLFLASTILMFAQTAIPRPFVVDVGDGDNYLYPRANVLGAGGLQVNTYTGNLFLVRSDLYISAGAPGHNSTRANVQRNEALGIALDITFSYNSGETKYDYGYGGGSTTRANVQRNYPGIALDITFSYNSGETKYDYGYGGGWTNTFNVVYEKIGSNICVKRWDGDRDTFKFSGAAYTPPVGCYDSLTQFALGKFRLRTKGGMEFLFEDSTHKKVTLIRDRNGNTITVAYSGGHPVRVTDVYGHLLSFTWSGGRMMQLVDSISSPAQTTSYAYDSDGNLVRVTDPLGNSIEYGYDFAKRLILVTDPLSTHFYVTYDDSDAVTRIQSPLSDESFGYNAGSKITTHTLGTTSTTYAYDAAGRVTDIAGVCCGYHRQFAYDSHNNITSFTDANGNITIYTYDMRGNRLTEQDALSHTATFTYDPVFNKVTSIQDKRGNTTSFIYDSKGNCTDISRPLGITEHYAYDSYGHITSYTDGRGNTTTFVYDGNGYMTGVTYPIGSESFTHDNVGNVLTHTDANGNTSTNTYDGLNRLITTQNALAEITSYTYDARSNVTSVTYPDGNTQNYTYDALGRITLVTDGIGTVQTNSYDNAGNLTSSTDGNGNITSYIHDSQNRLTSKTRGGVSESYTYDPVGNILTSTDGNGHATTYTYDWMNRLLTSSVGGVTVTMAYDNNGNITSRTDGKGNSTTYTHDALNRLTQQTFPDASSRHFTYDGNNNKITRTNNNGAVTSYTYDANNRRTKRDFPGSNDDNYTIDAGGRLLTANNNDALITYTYDGANRLLSETMNGHATGYSYNIAARQRTITYPGGSVVQETRNLRERLVSVSQGGVNVNFTYDAGNRLSTAAYGSNLTSTYSYNNRDLVTSLTYNSGAALVAGYDYGYDNAGNRTVAGDNYDSTRSEVYGYNSLDWLTGFRKGRLIGGSIPFPDDSTGYNYDNAGNWTSVSNGGTTTYTTNNLNQYTSRSPGGAISYDLNGNITASLTFGGSYDFENHLVSGIDSTTSAGVQCKYDALGRRIQKLITTNGGESWVVALNYYYDGNRVIEERNNANIVTATYTYGDEGIDDLLSLTRNGTTYFYLLNAHGSVIAIADNSGKVRERYDYDAFGKTTIWDSSYSVERTSSLIGNRFFFTSREYDAEIGMYYYRARHYDPTLGRFIQRDPIGVWGDPYNRGNGYEYVYNDPISYLDPLGKGAPGEAEAKLVSAVVALCLVTDCSLKSVQKDRNSGMKIYAVSVMKR